MNFKELIHNLDQDITKYNLFDERSMDNRNRDIFMKVSLFIYLIIFIFCMTCTDTSPASNPGSSSLYVEGNTMIESDQQLEFNYCYPQNLVGSAFSFSDNMGKVFMIEMSATW